MPEKFEGATPPQESKEKEVKPITFNVAEHGLETSVDEVLTKDEFNSRDPEHLV